MTRPLFTHATIRVVLNRINEIADITRFDVLDCFGGRGTYVTGHLKNRFKTLTIWEINSDCEADLRQQFPDAEIKICNAFDEIQRVEKKFDLVIMDHSITMSDYSVESYDLFPYVFRVLKDKAFLLPEITDPEKYYERHKIGHEVPGRIRARRKEFFKAYDIDGDKIPLDRACNRYYELAEENGFQVGPYSLVIARNHLYLDWFYYLLELQRL